MHAKVTKQVVKKGGSKEKSETTIATVVYLITEKTICLAQKKQPIHTKDGSVLKKSKDIWNGYGGKREEEDISVRDTAVRELFEESSVIAYPQNLIPAGKCNFFWEGNTTKTPNMEVYFFFCGTWKGKPEESNAMGKPVFFPITEIPYHEMMPNDALFLPKMLNNEKPVADISFKEKKGVREFIFIPRKEELAA